MDGVRKHKKAKYSAIGEPEQQVAGAMGHTVCM
jgi:hypothetical protein